MNAFAFKRDGSYFVGVTSGAIFVLGLVFSRMLRDRRLLTHIGDAAAEAENLPTISGLVPDADQMLALGVIPVGPKSDARSHYTSHLLDRSLLFLVGHEIAHIGCSVGVVRCDQMREVVHARDAGWVGHALHGKASPGPGLM